LSIAMSDVVVEPLECCEAIGCGRVGGLDIVKVAYYYTEEPRGLEICNG